MSRTLINLYCGPPVQTYRANPTCDRHTPPQDLSKSEERSRGGHTNKTYIYITVNRPADSL